MKARYQILNPYRITVAPCTLLPLAPRLNRIRPDAAGRDVLTWSHGGALKRASLEN